MKFVLVFAAVIASLLTFLWLAMTHPEWFLVSLFLLVCLIIAGAIYQEIS